MHKILRLNYVFGDLLKIGSTMLQECGILQQLIAGRPHCGGCLQAHRDDVVQINRILRGNSVKNTPLHLLVEPLHIICSKRRLQGTCLINHTSQRPDITLAIIGLISPHFGTCVVWGTSLGVDQSIFGDLRDVKIT